MKYLSSLALAGFLLTGCGKTSPEITAAEQKLNAIEKEINDLKAAGTANPRISQLEQQLAAARQEIAAAKSAPASGGATGTPPAAPVAPTAPKPREFTIPAGTKFKVRTTNTLSTKSARAGDAVTATLAEPITIDGVELAPKGSTVRGVITDSDAGGRVKGRASIAFTVKAILPEGGGEIPVVTSSPEFVAKSTVKRDVVRGGIMTGVGAAIGAIAGGGKGAAIGAGAGAAAGTGTAMATRGEAAVIPAESVVNFELREPAKITILPRP
jgi:outer membrane murein-binding lipoprotein Lpp